MRLRFESCAVASIARFISLSWVSFWAEAGTAAGPGFGGRLFGVSSWGGYPGRVEARWAVLATDACGHPVLKHLTRWPLDFFESPSGDDRPRYRYRPNATLPTGLVTNQIGWRGKPVEDQKSETDTIRIVFVGASTIAEAPALPWSAPELVDDWLNAWAQERGLGVRFEVLNAGREGAFTSDVVAIVRDEVAPLRPDLVVFYEGALTFDWSSVVKNATSLKALPRLLQA